jgi:hypothetical protein
VNGPHRDLHRERREEREEDEYLRVQRERHLIPVEERETSSGHVVQVDERNEREERAEQRVEEELERRVNAVRTAPDSDHHEHRNERRFEEHVEEQPVERGEHAVHEAGQQEKGREILRDALLNHLPARQHDQHRREAVQQDQQQRYAVYPEVVVDAERFDPRLQLDELEAARRSVEADVERNRDQEAQHGARERDDAGNLSVPVGSGREHGQPGHDGDPDR